MKTISDEQRERCRSVIDRLMNESDVEDLAGYEFMQALLSSEQASKENGKKLGEFAHQIIQIAFEGGSLDGGDIQDMGVKCGLLIETTYDPEIHGCPDHCSAEKGEEWYVYADCLKVTL
jgi:hypothetical protein